MPESLRTQAENLTDYLNRTVLDHDELSSHGILDALASLGITLVEDPVSDSTHTYYESLRRAVSESEDDTDTDATPG